MPIDDIDGQSPKTELKSSRYYSIMQSFKVKITPLVIYGFRGVYTRTHTYTHTLTE